MREYLALPDGPGGFRQGSTCPAVLRVPLACFWLCVRGSHPLWPAFRCRSARLPQWLTAALQPRPCGRFGLLRFRSPLLPESLLLSFPPGTEMFQFPGLHSLAYVFGQRMARVVPVPGFPIRIPTDRCALAAPRGVSPYAASFFSSACQDIRHAPFFV